ncbi:MAG: hypothetical protein P1V51_01540 [Deltaproteobacteria bacterium]|nr:hypothetical protein [Deltaproteobacteria bacterium]
MKRLSPLPLALLLALASTACLAPLEPCTECPDVAGTYEFVAQETTVESENGNLALCNEVYYTGVTDLVILQQSGSALQLTGYLSMEGTLYEDDTLAFNRVDFGETPVGPVTARISANFAPENGRKIIKGRLRFDIQEHDCDVWSVLTMTEVQ